MSIKVENLILGPVQANCYIITDCQTNESAVIDPGEFNESLKSAVSDKNIKYIMLTHGHFDHILGVYELKEYTHASVIIHPADAGCLEDSVKSLAFAAGAIWQMPVKADILVSHGDIVKLGNTEIKVMHTPGHTKGGVCYLIEKEKIIFTGDTLFSLTVGRTDFEGGSDEEMSESVKSIISLEGNYKIYTGHNRSTTLDYERQHNRYVRRMK